jgi:pimeloyl-ACP methyl ester carboxylesterase
VTRAIHISGPAARLLEVEVSGPDDGRAVVFHSGTPGSGTLFDATVEAGASRGLRHIAYSRPGYAGSDRHAGRSVADCAADVVAIVDALGVREFFTVGASGGGPHALACAALLGERVLGVATIGGVAPFDAPGLDWVAGMGQENLDEFAAAQAGTEELRAYLERERGEILEASGADIHATLDSLLSDVDRRALSGAYAEHLALSMRTGLAPGVWGWLDDDIAALHDWGFDLRAIERPVTIWQGRQDLFVPFAHGQWLVDNVPRAQPRLLDDHGHLSIALDRYGDVLDALIAG